MIVLNEHPVIERIDVEGIHFVDGIFRSLLRLAEDGSGVKLETKPNTSRTFADLAAETSLSAAE